MSDLDDFKPPMILPGTLKQIEAELAVDVGELVFLSDSSGKVVVRTRDGIHSVTGLGSVDDLTLTELPGDADLTGYTEVTEFTRTRPAVDRDETVGGFK